MEQNKVSALKELTVQWKGQTLPWLWVQHAVWTAPERMESRRLSKEEIDYLNQTSWRWEEQGWRPGGNSVVSSVRPWSGSEWLGHKCQRGLRLKRWGQLPLFLWQLLQKPLKFSALRSPTPWLAFKLSLLWVCVRVCVLMDCSPPVFSARGTSQNTGVGCRFLLQRILLTQAGTQSASLASPASAGRLFSTSATWEALNPNSYP